MREKRSRKPWAPPRPPIIALTLLFLTVANIFDAAATLELIRRGADEWNPLMRYALGFGDWYFIFLKSLITLVFSGFLALFALNRRRSAWWALCALTVMYLALIVLHLFLLYGVESAASLPFFR